MALDHIDRDDIQCWCRTCEEDFPVDEYNENHLHHDSFGEPVEQVVVDRDYLWALETVTVGFALQDVVGSDTEPVSQSDMVEAFELIHRADLTEPRARDDA